MPSVGEIVPTFKLFYLYHHALCGIIPMTVFILKERALGPKAEGCQILPTCGYFGVL